MTLRSGSQHARGCGLYPYRIGYAPGGKQGTVLLQRLLRMCILCTNWATKGNGPS